MFTSTWFDDLSPGEIIRVPVTRICIETDYPSNCYFMQNDPVAQDFRTLDKDSVFSLIKRKNGFVCLSHSTTQSYVFRLCKRQRQHLFDISIDFNAQPFSDFDAAYPDLWETWCQLYEDHLFFVFREMQEFSSDLLDLILNYLAAKETSFENIFLNQQCGWYSFSDTTIKTPCLVERTRKKTVVFTPLPPICRRYIDYVPTGSFKDDWSCCEIRPLVLWT